ncbi:hypothetical protein [Streptomyces lonarensis]|uniref:Uncharacterized protein n=1 Tax=Streptomyces lonarensis TaxID=700599 RepID=A0A7X6CYD7_9ACTN|nr:hypothetical protein [Streptomyces lonarensis]NJQ04833.1 hypothetical protein [Streptomyces lonarensis]
MILSSAVVAATTLAEGDGPNSSLNPYMVGGLVLVALLVLLFITMLLNRDR